MPTGSHQNNLINHLHPINHIQNHTESHGHNWLFLNIATSSYHITIHHMLPCKNPEKVVSSRETITVSLYGRFNLGLTRWPKICERPWKGPLDPLHPFNVIKALGLPITWVTMTLNEWHSNPFNWVLWSSNSQKATEIVALGCREKMFLRLSIDTHETRGMRQAGSIWVKLLHSWWFLSNCTAGTSPSHLRSTCFAAEQFSWRSGSTLNVP